MRKVVRKGSWSPSLLSCGGSFAPPTPPTNRRDPRRDPSSTVGSRRLKPALEGSPRQAAVCNRSVFVTSPVSPLKGRPGEPPHPSLHWEGALLPPRPSLQSVGGPSGLLLPLVVGAGFTFGKDAPRQFPRLAPKGAAVGASSSILASLAGFRRAGSCCYPW